MSEIPLSQLKSNTSGEIVKIQGELEMRQRLASLGFIRGTTIVVGHSAIMGGPRSYLLRGAQISLRQSEADKILVKVE
ncbi:MAG: ferrous iron transport protein A [Chromatiales bacterium]|nr:ferrous iron transport protein A [Chromatiales bacterium]